MLRVNMHAAKARLSQLVELVESGEHVVIARGGIPVVELVRVDPSLNTRRGGQWNGKARIADEFDAPMPDVEELFSG
jgi:antitoxin (DNA-binding transcriptional repressor) of toxin-antitoxin stability system